MGEAPNRMGRPKAYNTAHRIEKCTFLDLGKVKSADAHRHWPVTALRTVARTARKSSMAICPGAELLLPTAKVAAEP